MRSLSLLCLAMMIFLAGCAIGPFGGPSAQEEPVPVKLINEANETNTFEVLVVERPANVTTVRNDGLTANSWARQGVGSYSPGENYTWTTVKLPKSARLHGRYTLSPGEENITRIEEVPPRFAIAVVVYRAENEIISVKTVQCSKSALLGFRVTRRHGPAGGTSATYECGRPD